MDIKWSVYIPSWDIILELKLTKLWKSNCRKKFIIDISTNKYDLSYPNYPPEHTLQYNLQRKNSKYLNFGSLGWCGREWEGCGFLFASHCCLVWFQRIRPWFTNSPGVKFALLLLAVWSMAVLREEILLWDWWALLSISYVLVLHKSSDRLPLPLFTPVTLRPCILRPLEGSSTAVIGLDLEQHARQPLLCSKSHNFRQLYSISFSVVPLPPSCLT